MLTFTNINVTAVLLVALFFALNFAWWAFFVLFLIHGAICYWGTTQIHSQFHMPSYCKAIKHPRKEIAISFDDGVLNPAQTEKVLDTLAKYKATATFFCIGKNLESSAQQYTLKRIDAEGHLIGNHSYSHSNWFDFYSSNKVLQDLNLADDTIAQIICSKPLFFRPPYGITNPNIAKAVSASKHQTIGWSVRSLDTMFKDADKLLKRVAPKLHNGAIILFHDHLELMDTFLPLFLEYVLKEGYTIVGIDKLLGLEAYQN